MCSIAKMFILSTVLCVSATGVFAQDLLLSGPGNVILDGVKKTPFYKTIHLTIEPSKPYVTTTFAVPVGKTFVCTFGYAKGYSTVVNTKDKGHLSVEVTPGNNSWTGRLPGGFVLLSSKDSFYDDGNFNLILEGSRNMQMFLSATNTIAVGIPPSSLNKSVMVTLSGYLIDTPVLY